MRNYVKEYLDAGNSLEDLKNVYGISSNEYEGMIIFSYSQIDSPKTEPIVRMCRGLVLEKNTWNIVAYPFYRFYNFEEVPTEKTKFNWDQAVATEKIDGSLMQAFVYKDKWYISTRSQIGGKNMISDAIHSFGDLFDMAISPMTRDDFFNCLSWHKNAKSTPSMWNKGSVSLIFELVSEYNRIVTPYNETKLYLIGGRCMCELTKYKMYEEIPFETLYDTLSDDFRSIVKKPKVISLRDENGNFRGFDEMKKLAEAGEATDEGFVVVDWTSIDYNEDCSFPRVKVKNSAYIALHHLRGTIENGSMNYANIMSIVYKGETDEVCASLPQYEKYIRKVEIKYNKFVLSFESIVNNPEMNYFWQMSMDDRKKPENKKSFALLIMKKYKNYSSFLFMMFNQGLISLRVCIDEMSKKKSYSSVFDSLWENFVSKE